MKKELITAASLFAVMVAMFVLIAVLFVGCESTTQTAIRSNEVPAIAYVVAAEKGQALPTAVIIREYEAP